MHGLETVVLKQQGGPSPGYALWRRAGDFKINKFGNV